MCPQEQNTKEKIIQSAFKLFAVKSYAATSIREIARDALVSLASVNYHFGSKERLLVECLKSP